MTNHILQFTKCCMIFKIVLWFHSLLPNSLQKHGKISLHTILINQSQLWYTAWLPCREKYVHQRDPHLWWHILVNQTAGRAVICEAQYFVQGYYSTGILCLRYHCTVYVLWIHCSCLIVKLILQTRLLKQASRMWAGTIHSDQLCCWSHSTSAVVYCALCKLERRHAYTYIHYVSTSSNEEAYM